MREKLGVPSEAIACLEVSKEQPQLYSVLLDYIFHRGVDVDQVAQCALEKPPNDANNLEREYPGRLSALSCSSVINNYKRNKKNSTGKEDGAVALKENGVKKSAEKIIAADEIISADKDIAGKEAEGTDTTGSKGTENVNGKAGDKIVEAKAADNVDEASESDTEEVRPPAPTFRFGLGTARLDIGGTEVYVKHEMYGAPLSFITTKQMQGFGFRGKYGGMYGGMFGGLSDVPRTAPPPEKDSTCFRALFIYARSPETLKKLSMAALEWDFVRNKPDFDPRSGKYQLFSLVVRGTAMWECQGWKASRRLDSIILPPGQLDAIVSDFREFSAKETKAWYIAHGLPYRRSYLFHGPPGVGKTSTIRALAGALEVSACFMSLGDYKIGNGELQDALRTLPPCPSMLVVEDVDALFTETRKSDSPSPLTFSALLNALDGLVSADGVLTVMTTNHLERLDPALIRAGRVDRRFCFKAPTKEQMRALFLSFYPDAPHKLANEFAEGVFVRPEKEARSIATLQEHFIFTRKKTARESVDALDDFFKEFYPGGGYDVKSVLYA